VTIDTETYALPSWGCFLTAELSGKIDAFLRRAHRHGLAANILTVCELFDGVAQDFLQQKNRPTIVFFILCI